MPRGCVAGGRSPPAAARPRAGGPAQL